MNLVIDVAIEGGEWPPEGELRELAARVGAAVLEEIGTTKAWPGEAGWSLLFADDDRIAALNGAWRGKPAPTDVLSFPAEDLAPGDAPGPEIGDVVLASGVLARDAAAGGRSLADHTAHLLAHGLLHCLGYDHETSDEDAEAMEAIETRALARLGIADPYGHSHAEPAAANGKPSVTGEGGA